MIRRVLALIFCALALAGSLAACGGSSGSRLWVTHPRVFTACSSPDCGPNALTLNWATIQFSGRTGYFVFLNGVQIADVVPSKYTFYGLDCGATFTFGVRAHNGSGGTSGLVSTSYTSPACPGASAPTNLGLPLISGTTTQGQTLSTTNGTWSGSPTSFAYQWQRCTITCSNIASANGSSYLLALADVGDTIQVIVTATNAAGSTPATSARTATIAGSGGGAVPVNTTQPWFAAGTLSGSSCTAGCAVQGQQLSVGTGTWSGSPASYTYQWQACTTTSAQPPTTGSCSSLGSANGAQSATYTVQAADVGKALAVNVTATNSSGSASTTTAGSCNTAMIYAANQNNGHAGCSPMSAAVGATQAGQEYCTNAPVTCGMADWSNTGVPPGTTLFRVPEDVTDPSQCPAGACGSGWTYDGSINVGTNGTAQAVSCHCQVFLSSGSTLKNSFLQQDSGADTIWEIHTGDGNSNQTVDHNTVRGLTQAFTNTCGSALFDNYNTAANTTITNNNVWWCGGLDYQYANGGLMANNYTHDLYTCSCGAHFEDVQLQKGNGSLITVRNNTLFNNHLDETAVIILSSDNTTNESNRIVDHNLMAGGGYCFYAAASSGVVTTNLTFTSNHFSRFYDPKCGNNNAQAGPVLYWSDGSGDVWGAGAQTNVWDDDGTAVPKG